MLRNIVAVVVGVIVGGIIKLSSSVLFPQNLPLPEGMSLMSIAEDPEALHAWVVSWPRTVFILILVTYLAMSFFGGYIAAFISKKNVMGVAIAVGAISFLIGFVNMVGLPAPLWFWIGMPLYLVAACFAGKLELKRRTAAS